MRDRIKCEAVDYRKGFIEVATGIHDGRINLEMWNVRADLDLSNQDIRDSTFPDDGVTANTEIEMSIDDARSLLRLLELALVATAK